MHESKFRSSVLFWRKYKFCFSSKVMWSVGDGRIMPFYSLDLSVGFFFFGEQDCRLGWQKAGQLAAGGGGHFTQSWSVRLIPVLCSSGAVETLRGKTPALHTQTLISFTSPMLCVHHPSIGGNACAIYLLFVCWELQKKKKKEVKLQQFASLLGTSGFLAKFYLFSRGVWPKLLLPFLVTLCPGLLFWVTPGTLGSWEGRIRPALLYLGLCSYCCSNRWRVHSFWAVSLSNGSSWVGREKEVFMSLQITFKGIGGSQGK